MLPPPHSGATWHPVLLKHVEHGAIVGKTYLGNDLHRRTVKAVEYLAGNISIQVYDTFWSRVEWMSLPDWFEQNPLGKKGFTADE
jgi:hypothetical protein